MQIDIKNVVFLTPAKITANIDGEDHDIIASVDFINKKIYIGEEELKWQKDVFDYLDGINTLPEDFFAAPEEVVEEAKAAEMSYEQIKNQSLGVEWAI